MVKMHFVIILIKLLCMYVPITYRAHYVRQCLYSNMAAVTSCSR